MVTFTDTWMTDNNSTNQINDGRQIFLNATSIRMGANAYIARPDRPGRDPDNLTHNNYKSSGDWLGSSNLTITVTGNIEIVKEDLSTDIDVTNISLKLLQQMIKSGHVFRLFDYWDSSRPRWRAHGLGNIAGTVFPDEVETELYVRPLSFDVDIICKSGTEGRVIQYNLVLLEVKNE